MTILKSSRDKPINTTKFSCSYKFDLLMLSTFFKRILLTAELITLKTPAATAVNPRGTDAMIPTPVAAVAAATIEEPTLVKPAPAFK